MEEIDVFEELRELGPYHGAKDGSSIKAYLLDFFRRNQPATYFTNGERQCAPGVMRGFYDIYYIVKAVFRYATIEEVAKVLIEFCEDYKNTLVGVRYNDDVEKIVFGNFSNLDSDLNLLSNKDEFMQLEDVEKYGVDNLCLLDIISLAGKKRINIKTIDEQ